MHHNGIVAVGNPTIAQLIVQAYNNAGRPSGMFQTIDEAERVVKSDGKGGAKAPLPR
jgi:hypothetical protein